MNTWSLLLSRWYGRLTTQPVLVLFLVTFAVVAFLNPIKIGLALWGICKLALFGYAGAWLSTRLFRAMREDDPGIVEGVLWKLKAAIVCASILAGALLP